MSNYIALVQYFEGGEVKVLTTKKSNSSYLVCSEENKHLMLDILQRLMDDGLIYSYQFAILSGDAVTSV